MWGLRCGERGGCLGGGCLGGECLGGECLGGGCLGEFEVWVWRSMKEF